MWYNIMCGALVYLILQLDCANVVMHVMGVARVGSG